MNEAAIKSKSFSTPNLISSLSLSLRNGSERVIFGTFIPLLEDTYPPFMTVQIIPPSFFSMTLSSIRPSSMRILEPILTSS